VRTLRNGERNSMMTKRVIVLAIGGSRASSGRAAPPARRDARKP
jgi:hypothetical protein